MYAPAGPLTNQSTHCLPSSLVPFRSLMPAACGGIPPWNAACTCVSCCFRYGARNRLRPTLRPLPPLDLHPHMQPLHEGGEGILMHGVLPQGAVRGRQKARILLLQLPLLPRCLYNSPDAPRALLLPLYIRFNAPLLLVVSLNCRERRVVKCAACMCSSA